MRTKERGQELKLKLSSRHRSAILMAGRAFMPKAWYLLDPPCRMCGRDQVFQVLSSGREEFYCEGFHLQLRLPLGTRP